MAILVETLKYFNMFRNQTCVDDSANICCDFCDWAINKQGKTLAESKQCYKMNNFFSSKKAITEIQMDVFLEYRVIAIRKLNGIWSSISGGFFWKQPFHCIRSAKIYKGAIIFRTSQTMCIPHVIRSRLHKNQILARYYYRGPLKGSYNKI